MQASKPTHGTAGISTPACNNGALTILRNVVVTGYNTGIIVNEHTDEDTKWQATDFNIHDPQNLGFGDINYWVVEGNVGAVDKFTRNGGASIRVRRIGSAPTEKKKPAK